MRKLLSAMATALMAVAVTTPAGAATQGTDRACPAGYVPDSAYNDVEGTVHGDAVDCLVWWTVDVFGGSGNFQPAAKLTRAEHAAMLSKLLDATGLADLGDRSDRGYQDIRGHRYEHQINRMASLGVVRGKSSTTFDPEGLIQRDQMASLIVQLHENVYGQTVGPGAGFDDTDGNVHEPNIRRLVATGITSGKTERTYDPGGHVTRGQISSFTMRHADLLVELGRATAPNDFEAVTFSGVGDDVIEFTPGALAIADLTHDGQSNFAVWAFDSNGDNTNLVANEIGDYSGTGAVNFGHSDDVAGFDVDADGSWTLIVRPAHEARRLGADGGGGTGGDVVAVQALAGQTVELTHDGDSNFAIWAYNAAGETLDLVANEIGPYQGRQRVPADTTFLEVNADGTWTIAPAS